MWIHFIHVAEHGGAAQRIIRGVFGNHRKVSCMWNLCSIANEHSERIPACNSSCPFVVSIILRWNVHSHHPCFERILRSNPRARRRGRRR